MAQTIEQLDKTEQRVLLDKWEADSQTATTLGQNGLGLPAELTLAGGINLFLATLKGQSSATGRTYRAGCRRFMWFIYVTERGVPAEITIAALSPYVLEEFYLWLVETFGRKARATHSSYMAATRNLFEYLASRELTPSNCQYSKMIARLGKLQGRASYRTPRIRGRQVEQVAQLALGSNNSEEKPEIASVSDATADSENEPEANVKISKKRTARSPEEIGRQKLEELRDRAIILTLYTTGMRRQEVASLNRGEVEDLIAENERLRQKKPRSEPKEPGVFELIITGKGQKERVVYFDAVTLAALGEYLAGRGKDGFRPLFLQHHRGRTKVKPGPGGERYRVSLVTVWQVVLRYAHRLGVEIKPHDFRHNLATTLLNAGAQLSEVQDILGHASPTTTKQIYAHYDKGHLREAFSKFRKSASEIGMRDEG